MKQFQIKLNKFQVNMNWEIFSIKLISGNIDIYLDPSICIIFLSYLGLLEVKWDYILSIMNMSKRKGTQ